MKTNEKDIELIERYIDGELSEKDIELFEKRLKNDPDFAKEYKNRVKIGQLWKEAEIYEETKKEIAGILISEKPSFIRTHKYYIMSIAASIVALLGIYLLFFQTDQSFMQDNQIVLTDSSAIAEDSISFKMDEPTKLASVKILKDVKLISPDDNFNYAADEAIILEWFSSSKDFDTLFIYSKTAKTIIIKQIIQQQEDTINYNIGRLPEGEYVWYLNDTLKRNKFTISKSK